MKNEPKISSLIDKAIFDYQLIEENDKILLGASGGKDSTLLIEYFANSKQNFQCWIKIQNGIFLYNIIFFIYLIPYL